MRNLATAREGGSISFVTADEMVLLSCREKRTFPVSTRQPRRWGERRCGERRCGEGLCGERRCGERRRCGDGGGEENSSIFVYVLLLNANKAVPNSNKECYHFVPLIDHMTLRAFSLETWRASSYWQPSNHERAKVQKKQDKVRFTRNHLPTNVTVL